MSASAANDGAEIDRMIAAAKSLIFISRPRIQPVAFGPHRARAGKSESAISLFRHPVFPNPAARATRGSRNSGHFPAERVQISTGRGHTGV
jgi:hypothetical protein